MSFFRTIISPAILATTLGTAVLAGGHGQTPEDAAIAARQAHMTLYGFNLGVLGGMAQDKMDYDADLAASAAANLSALANMDLARYWVPGTASSDVEDSRLKPEALADMAEFNAKIEALATASVALAEAAGTDLDALKAAFGPVGGVCGDCHRTFRERAN